MRAVKWEDFADTTPGTNFTLFAGPFPTDDSALEHRLSCHPDQVFVNYDCSSLKDGFNLGYYWPQKYENSRNLTSANENPDWSDITFPKKWMVDAY